MGRKEREKTKVKEKNNTRVTEKTKKEEQGGECQ